MGMVINNLFSITYELFLFVLMIFLFRFKYNSKKVYPTKS
jgi:hypothetical protein